MPTIQGFLRRRGPTSDVDIRRHSLYAGDPSINDMLEARGSEQLHRQTSASSFQVLSESSPPAVNVIPAEPENRPDSPPVQDENPKHRRFSMLKFRHASDSQLSIRARQQANVAVA